MNIHSLLPLLAAIAYIPLVIFTATSRPWQKHHIIFVIFLLSGMLWSLATFFMRSDYFPEHKLFLFQITTCAYFLFIVHFYFFIKYYLHKKSGTGVYIGYILLSTVVAISILGYLPESLTIEEGIVSPTIGIWFYPIMLALYGLAFHAIFILVKRFRYSRDPVERNRMIYLFFAVILLFIFGIINATPLGDRFPMAQIGHLANAALLTYATLKYKILDMNRLIRHSFIYSSMIATCMAIYVAWMLLIGLLFDLDQNYPLIIGIGVLTGLTVSFFWVKLRDSLYSRIDTIFYGESYDHRKTLSNFVKRDIGHVFSLEELAQTLLPILVKVLNCKDVYMLLPETSSKDFIAKYAEPGRIMESPFIIKHESPICKWFIRENKYLNINSIETSPEFKSLWKNEKDQLSALEIELLFPLISRDNLVGILAFSHKISGKYNLDEINLIEGISGQIAISVEKEYIQAELRRNEQELALINKLSGVMTSSLNINEVYDVFAAGLREVIDIDFAAVVTIEENELVISAIYAEIDTPWQAGQKLKLKGSGTEWVKRHRKSLYEPDLERDKMFYTGDEHLKRGIHSV